MKVTLKSVSQENFPLLMTLEATLSSKPELVIAPIFWLMLLPGTPKDGAVGAAKIKPSTSLLK